MVLAANEVIEIVHIADFCKDSHLITQFFAAFADHRLLRIFALVNPTTRGFKIIVMTEQIVPHDVVQSEMAMAIADEGTRNFTDFSNRLMRIFLIAKAKDYFHSLLLSTLEIHLKR